MLMMDGMGNYDLHQKPDATNVKNLIEYPRESNRGPRALKYTFPPI